MTHYRQISGNINAIDDGEGANRPSHNDLLVYVCKHINMHTVYKHLNENATRTRYSGNCSSLSDVARRPVNSGALSELAEGQSLRDLRVGQQQILHGNYYADSAFPSWIRRRTASTMKKANSSRARCPLGVPAYDFWSTRRFLVTSNSSSSNGIDTSDFVRLAD